MRKAELKMAPKNVHSRAYHQKLAECLRAGTDEATSKAGLWVGVGEWESSGICFDRVFGPP